jgi:hypothetical protein
MHTKVACCPVGGAAVHVRAALHIVPRYDWDTIKRALTDICEAAPGDDWESISTYLARYGAWEFEDYKGFEGQGG